MTGCPQAGCAFGGWGDWHVIVSEVGWRDHGARFMSPAGPVSAAAAAGPRNLSVWPQKAQGPQSQPADRGGGHRDPGATGPPN